MKKSKWTNFLDVFPKPFKLKHFRRCPICDGPMVISDEITIKHKTRTTVIYRACLWCASVFTSEE